MAAPFTCLILEDDDAFAAMATEVVTRAGGTVERAASIGDARQRIDSRVFDLALLDNRMPDGTGYAFHGELVHRQPGCLAIMMTGAPELAQAVALTRNGLFEYLTKPIASETLEACLGRIRQRLSVATRFASDEAEELVGDSPGMREVLHLLGQASRHSTATVLIQGETGTGKDLAARTLHRLTFPPDGHAAPFVPLNCSAVPESMFEAELFGNEKGAFTGADRRRSGLAEIAGHGTLFLDEVGEIPLSQQAKLLRFLESREFRPLGSSSLRGFAGRIVAATNRDLAVDAKAGRFRGDLLYRLDVLAVRLPPLREHLGDLEALAQRLLARLASKYQRPAPHFRSEELARLLRHDFPGNVRELRNLLERSLLRTDVESHWLALDLKWLPNADAVGIGLPPVGPALPVTAAPFPEPSGEAPDGAGDRAGDTSGLPISSEPPPNRVLSPLELQEYRLIARTLREEAGAIRRSALRLGLTHQALLRRLQKWPELRREGDPATS